VVDLRDRVIRLFDGELDLRPWQIVTVRLHRGKVTSAR
jgi:hypothetical protein